MDLIQQCFYFSTGWCWDNTYEHILATPRNLLQFPIPNGVNIVASNRNTPFNFSSITISQIDNLEGSLSYLSSCTNLDSYYKPSHSLPISNVLQGYRTAPINHPDTASYGGNTDKPYLLYGKMYFPSQFLEGMLIKRFSPNYQLIVKFVNTPKLNKLIQPTSIFTFYLQRQTETSSHDFIYSTREDLFGLRCLYHFDLINSNFNQNPLNRHGFISSRLRSDALQHPSTFSAGCELWYSVGSVSPGMSIAARYTTYIDSMRYLMNTMPTYSPAFINSDLHSYISNGGKKIIRSIPYAISTIHPLTFTIAMNPLLGTFESTYAIKSDLHFKDNGYNEDENVTSMGKIGVVLSSKYQFNIYSYDSDLILGAQLLRSKISSWNQIDEDATTIQKQNIASGNAGSKQNNAESQQKYLMNTLSPMNRHSVVYQVADKELIERNVEAPIVEPTDPPTAHESLDQLSPETSATNQDDEYISSLKVSGSLTKRNLRIAWEGKFHDWFVSSGASFDMKGINSGPRVLKYGIEFSYNS